MKPVKFKEFNITFAENQTEYQPLPAYKSDDGEVISCWELTLWERVRVLFGGKMWFRILTFNEPLQPLLPEVISPFIKK